MSSRFSPSASRSRSSAPANTVQVELIFTRLGRLHRQRPQLVHAEVHLVGDVAEVAAATGGAAVVHLEAGDDARCRRPGWPSCPGRRCRARCACRGTSRARRGRGRGSRCGSVPWEGQALAAVARCRPMPSIARSALGVVSRPRATASAERREACGGDAAVAKSRPLRYRPAKLVDAVLDDQMMAASNRPTRRSNDTGSSRVTCSACFRYWLAARSRKKSLRALPPRGQLGLVVRARPSDRRCAHRSRPYVRRWRCAGVSPLPASTGAGRAAVRGAAGPEVPLQAAGNRISGSAGCPIARAGFGLLRAQAEAGLDLRTTRHRQARRSCCGCW